MAPSENIPSYENIIENLNEGVIAVIPSLEVTVFNQAAERMVEFSRAQALGRNLAEVFAMDRWLVEMMRMTIEGGKLFSDYEETLHRRISPPMPVAVSTTQVFDPEGNLTGAAVLMKDLTGIRSLESETLRKERLAYIGSFAANIAHEIKNPLGGIKGSAQLLAKKLKDGSLREYTDVIIKEADRLNRIVREMLDFTKTKKLRKKNLNIYKVLDAVISLVEREEGGPAVVRRYDPSLPAVTGDEGKLTQVFLNLVKNAVEAVGGRDGEVSVSTRMVTEFHIVAEGSKEAKFAEIEISDTGCGIPQENLEKIFTPFFTTKPGGSGLGMAISYRIIKEHGGFLKIESSPGKGTRVMVYLPVGIEQT